MSRGRGCAQGTGSSGGARPSHPPTYTPARTSRSTVYLTLLNSIDPAKCPKDALTVEDPNARAVAVIDNARAIDVPVMIQPSDITSGNRKLNLAFVAQIFNTHHGLEMKEEEMKASGACERPSAERTAPYPPPPPLPSLATWQVVEQAFDSVGLSDEPEEDAREVRVQRACGAVPP